MTFMFDDMHSELSELMLIQVQNIDVLKSRSQLFRNILCKHDNTDNSLINVDYHVNYFINELSPFRRDTTAYINRLIIKDLGDNTKTVNDFRYDYPLSQLIVSFNYYGCDQFQEELVNSIAAETPERYLNSIMEFLIKLSDKSDSIKTFVEKVTMKLK